MYLIASFVLFVLWGLTPHSVFLPECDLRKGLVFVLFYFTTLVGAFIDRFAPENGEFSREA